MSLILASASPFRAALLTKCGVAFEVIPSSVDESKTKEAMRVTGRSAHDLALTLAAMKARQVSMQYPDRLVLGADQTCNCEGIWIDKPSSHNAARDLLLRHRNKVHRLYSAAVCMENGEQVWYAVEQATFHLRDYSDAVVDWYIDVEKENILKTIGGLRIEGAGLQLCDQVEGRQDVIIGLPMLPLLVFLRQRGIVVS